MLPPGMSMQSADPSIEICRCPNKPSRTCSGSRCGASAAGRREKAGKAGEAPEWEERAAWWEAGWEAEEEAEDAAPRRPPFLERFRSRDVRVVCGSLVKKTTPRTVMATTTARKRRCREVEEGTVTACPLFSDAGAIAEMAEMRRWSEEACLGVAEAQRRAVV